jgi:hypothetical protein
LAVKADSLRNARLVASTTLLSLWGYSHLAQTPVLGNTVAPLILALLLAPGANWFGRHGRGGYRPLLVALLAFAAITALLYWMGSTATLASFGHSPWLVIPLWGLGLFGLVRNATGAERSTASAQAACAAAHAADAG